MALVPLELAFWVGPYSGFTLLFSIIDQFVLAIGAGIVLLYVVARGMHFADE